MSDVSHDQPSATAMVDALNNTFGSHGKRASHPKGVSALGFFEPNPTAHTFSTSPIFEPGHYPARVRFSIAGGNPNVPDKAPAARGMAIRIDGPRGERLTLVMISAPVFFAASRASFVSFLEARRPDPETGKANPQKIDESNMTHTDSEAQRRWLASTAPSISYATAPYFAVHTYLFDQSNGTKRPARWIFEPVAGRIGFSPAELNGIPDHFLVDELRARLREGPAQWRVLAMIPQAIDPLHNPTANWPETRETVELGMLTVTSLAALGTVEDSDGTVFDPMNLPQGIAPAGDPIFDSRSEAYAVSALRRGL